MTKEVLIGRSRRRRAVTVVDGLRKRVQELERTPRIGGSVESSSSIIVTINSKRYRITAARVT